MKKIIALSLIVVTMVGCKTTSLDPNVRTMDKKLANMERAVVLMADPVSVKASELNQGVRAGAALVGSGVTVAAGSAAYGNRNAAAAAGAVALVGLGVMAISSIADNQMVEATAYTIQMMDSGEMTEIVQQEAEGVMPFYPNTPVLVKTYTDGSSFIFEDRSQGVQYNRAESTNFAGDAQKRAAIEAEQSAKKSKADEHEAWLLEQEKRRIEANTKAIETHSQKTGETIDARNDAVRSFGKGIENHGIRQ